MFKEPKRPLAESLYALKTEEERAQYEEKRKLDAEARKLGHKHRQPNFVNRRDDHTWEFTPEELLQMKANMDVQDGQNFFQSNWR